VTTIQPTDIESFQGTFPVSSAAGVLDSGTGVGNGYSLQGNTNTFNTLLCNGVAGCVGWQQFVFENQFPVTGQGTKSFIFMQYWLINCQGKCGGTGVPCPANPPPPAPPWNSFTDPVTGVQSCFRNNTGSPDFLPNQLVGALDDVSLLGGVDPSFDYVMLGLSDGTLYEADEPSVLGLGSYPPGWKDIEFDVFGQSGGSQAIFNANTTMRPRTGLWRVNGTVDPPSCLNKSFTGETNSLSLVPNSCCPVFPHDDAQPFIEFTESNDASVTAPFCLLNEIAPFLATFR
jgi:hypothetical protein